MNHMASYGIDMILFLIGYVAGSIPFGKLVARTYGIDIQQRGSGNIGFANVRRVLGWRAGIVTLAADVTKGFIPVMIALQFVDETLAFFIGTAAIAGHLFPVWLRFRGGKGIATGLGIVLALHPVSALVGAMMYGIGCLVTRVSSYSSLFGLLGTACIGTALSPSTWWQYGILLVIALWTLRHNLAGKVPNYDT